VQSRRSQKIGGGGYFVGRCDRLSGLVCRKAGHFLAQKRGVGGGWGRRGRGRRVRVQSAGPRHLTIVRLSGFPADVKKPALGGLHGLAGLARLLVSGVLKS
jgi:hypothetical protein